MDTTRLLAEIPGRSSDPLGILPAHPASVVPPTFLDAMRQVLEAAYGIPPIQVGAPPDNYLVGRELPTGRLWEQSCDLAGRCLQNGQCRKFFECTGVSDTRVRDAVTREVIENSECFEKDVCMLDDNCPFFYTCEEAERAAEEDR